MKNYYIFIRLSGLLLLGLLTSPSGVLASFYPPDYVIQRSCQTQGAVEVCAINQHFGHYPRISVTYSGELMAEYWGRIVARVELNGRQGVFSMSNSDYRELLMLNDPRSYLCWVVDSENPPQGEEPPGPYRWCRFTQAPGGRGIVWEAIPPPAAESEIFFYARNHYGQGNAWDIVVSFASEDGAYESVPGCQECPRSYRFRFEP